MIEGTAHSLLSGSVEKVLETMFFASPDTMSMDPQRPAGELIAASLTFQGVPPGWFGLVVSDPLARTLTANFMGCDDTPSLLPEQVAGVVGELANMICGAVLSQMESDVNFDLGAPESVRVSAGDPGPDYTAGTPSVCRFEFAEGALVAFLAFQERA
jgi:CheY-specific phosphatase CheX